MIKFSICIELSFLLQVCNRIRGREPAAAKPEKHVVCIGLTQSGKSTALALLAGEPIDKIEPTDGFHIKDLLLKDCMLNVKEIGGNCRLEFRAQLLLDIRLRL